MIWTFEGAFLGIYACVEQVKKVEAVIKSFKLEEAKEALSNNGIKGLTATLTLEKP